MTSIETLASKLELVIKHLGLHAPGSLNTSSDCKSDKTWVESKEVKCVPEQNDQVAPKQVVPKEEVKQSCQEVKQTCQEVKQPCQEIKQEIKENCQELKQEIKENKALPNTKYEDCKRSLSNVLAFVLKDKIQCQQNNWIVTSDEKVRREKIFVKLPQIEHVGNEEWTHAKDCLDTYLGTKAAKQFNVSENKEVKDSKELVAEFTVEIPIDQSRKTVDECWRILVPCILSMLVESRTSNNMIVKRNIPAEFSYSEVSLELTKPYLTSKIAEFNSIYGTNCIAFVTAKTAQTTGQICIVKNADIIKNRFHSEWFTA